MKKRNQRLCVYPKDIQRITGRSDRYSRQLLHTIKNHFGKQAHQALSAEEVSTYLGLPVESVREALSH